MKATELLTNCGTFTVQEDINEAKQNVEKGLPLTKLSGREWTIKGKEYTAEETFTLTDEVKVYAYTSIILESVSYEAEQDSE